MATTPIIPAEWKTRIPTNINPLSPSGFRFKITKLPSMEFFCQTVNLPGITLGEPSYGTPFSTIPVPGEHLTFDDLRVQFLVDEDMSNFKALHTWLYGLGFPIDRQQYKDLLTQDTVTGGPNSELTKNYSDASLFILTNNNTESILVSFKNLFPTTLESVTFTGVDSDVQYLIGQATFKFGYYTFER